jgi:hypothetical protein
MIIGVEFSKGSKLYQYLAPDEFGVAVGDLVETPQPGPLAQYYGDRQARVVNLFGNGYPVRATKGIVRVVERHAERPVRVVVDMTLAEAQHNIRMQNRLSRRNDRETQNPFRKALAQTLRDMGEYPDA